MQYKYVTSVEQVLISFYNFVDHKRLNLKGIVFVYYPRPVLEVYP